MSDENKTYLGDGVYAEHDGYMISVYTSNGITKGEPIYFEPEVLDALIRFSKRGQPPEPKEST